MSNWLTTLRLKAGYRSMRALSVDSKVDVSTLARIEHEIHVASPETLKRLAPYLKTPYIKLLAFAATWLMILNLKRRRSTIGRSRMVRHPASKTIGLKCARRCEWPKTPPPRKIEAASQGLSGRRWEYSPMRH